MFLLILSKIIPEVHFEPRFCLCRVRHEAEVHVRVYCAQAVDGPGRRVVGLGAPGGQLGLVAGAAGGPAGLGIVHAWLIKYSFTQERLMEKNSGLTWPSQDAA